MESSRSSRAKKRQYAISQKTLQESFQNIQSKGEGDVTFDCMVCNESHKSLEEFRKHIVTRHRPTLCEPNVLCIDAEYLDPQEKHIKCAEESIKEVKGDCEGSDCEVCGQTFIDSTDLETHMKKHKDSFIYNCNICGRRFKEPWFLKNHKRTHSRHTGGKNKQAIVETPITINEIVQEQVAKNDTSPYILCKVCGFFFHDKETLLDHSKIHIKELVTCKESATREEENVSKDAFMNFLHLKPSNPEAKKPEASSKSVGELDPFTTYQTWQLATKGKVALGSGHAKEPLFEVNLETDCDKDESIYICNKRKRSRSAQNGPCKSDNYLHESKKHNTEWEAKVQSSQDKTPFCTDCGKLFRTYKQLELHCRVHRKDRNSSSESSAMSKIEGLPPARSPDSPASVEEQKTVKREKRKQTDVGGDDLISEKMNNGQEVRITQGSSKCNVCGKSYRSKHYFNIHLRTHTEKRNNGQEVHKTKGSRECNVCGKSFRSKNYRIIHLRTHTGEKPCKCLYCDYAAAQKTSLRYHFERHHNLKPGESNALVRSINIKEGKLRQKLITDTKEDTVLSKPPKRMSARQNKLMNKKHLLQRETTVCNGQEKPVLEDLPKTPIMKISLACEETLDAEMCSNEEKSQESQVFMSSTAEDIEMIPLDLSMKSAERASSTLYNSALYVFTCPFCTFKTLYPEVLTIHQKIVHKQSNDFGHKNGIRSKNVMKMRRTGCPPALQGNDVSSVQLDGVKIIGSSLASAKALNHEKPKRAPAPSNKASKSHTYCKKTEQENKVKSVQVGLYRHLQPDLQGITRVLEKIQHSDQKLTPWTSSPNTQTNSGGMNGSECPYHVKSSLFEENSFARPTHLKLGESFTKRTKRGMSVSASSSNYAEVTQRSHPSLVDMHNLDGPPIKPCSAVLDNVPYPNEDDSRWNLKLYEQSQIGAPFDSGNSSSGQGSSSSGEGKQNSLYRRLSKRGFGPNEYRP